VRGIPIATRLGIGLARLGTGGSPAEALRAALAAAQDSRHEAAGWARYDRQSDAAQQRAFRLLTDLRIALEAEDQLTLAFQPRVALATGQVVGAEALLRWTHPELGAIPPGEFVALAETTALMAPLTRWVARHAIAQLGRWRAAGRELTLSFNVSPTHLRESWLADFLAGELRQRRVPPAALEVELTEGAFAASEPLVRRQIERVHALGVALAIDDFGTGYSNIEYLTRIPARTLKIDQSFVRPLATEPRHRLLVRAIIGMADGLGFRTVAEGIETAAAAALLRGWGCAEGQGYLFGRPGPAAGLPAASAPSP
jgi:EAL domain-containing protein (putative c-di-GMP-specific phosphodiesterase class I)